MSRQEGHGGIRRRQGTQRPAGPVRTVAALLGEVAIDEHGEEPMGGGGGNTEPRRGVGEPHGPLGLQELGEP